MMKLPKLDASNPLNIALAISILIVVVSIVARKSLSGRSYRSAVDVDQLRPGFDSGPLAARAWDAFRGLKFFSGPKIRVMGELTALNNEELKAVYNTYNERYRTAPDTLLTDIRGEWVWGVGVNALVTRMETLGLQ